jgi:hypothetical protein
MSHSYGLIAETAVFHASNYLLCVPRKSYLLPILGIVDFLATRIIL